MRIYPYQLDLDVLSRLLEPYDIHVLELATDQIDSRALVSLQPTESVSAAASKLKGRVSEWQTDHAVTVLNYHVVLATWRRRGTFRPSSAKAVCDCWQALQSDHRVVIDKVSFVPDHVHVALALHPSKSPAETVVAIISAVQELMWDTFADTVVQAGVERLWQPSAYIGSFGDLSSNAVSAYVERWEGRR